MGKIEQRLKEKGIELPPPPSPMGAYVPVVRTGNLLFISGQLPRKGPELVYTGKVDRELSLDQARDAARLCALNALSALKAELKELDRVRRVVLLRVSVLSSEGFSDQPLVANAASETLVEVFGDKGRHARMAAGVNELPARASVAVELVVEAEPE